jgi:hypothetical protein
MASEFNDNIFSASPKLLDAKWGPFESPAAAIAAVPRIYREIGMFAIIAPPGGTASLYWYQNNIDNLVPFVGNSSVEVYDVKTGATGGQTEFPPTGSANVIYIDKSTSSSYYWNASTNPPEYTLTGNGESSVEVYPSKTGSTPGTDSFPTIGVVNVIYVANDTNISYIWNPALLNDAGDYEIISGSIADTGNIRFDESIIFSTENFVDIHTDDEYVQFSYTNTAFDNNPLEINQNFFWLDNTGAHIEVNGNNVDGNPYSYGWNFSSSDGILSVPGRISFGNINYQSIGVGNVSAHAGYYGISLYCSVGYELNWQEGYLAARNPNSPYDLRPIYLDSLIDYSEDKSSSYTTRSLVDKEYVDSRTVGFEQNFLLMGG